MARRGRPPKNKKKVQSSILDIFDTKSTKKKKKKTTKKKKGKSQNHEDMPLARRWIYSASSSIEGGATAAETEDGYEHYLNMRVQRPVVRSLPGNYSYFQDNRKDTEDDIYEVIDVDDDDGQEAATDKVKQKLNFAHVPLPPLETPASKASNNDPDNNNANAGSSANDNDDSAAYSKFTQPIITKDSRLAKFRFSLNHGTHVPDRNLISHVGNAANAAGVGVDEGGESSGYVMQMPLVEGTVIGYSPPLDNDDDDDEYHYEVSEEEEAEFPVQRQKPDEPLFRILWDGAATNTAETDENSAAHDHDDEGDDDDKESENKKNVRMMTGYAEDITLPELLSALATHPSELSTKQRLNHKKSLVAPYSSSRKKNNKEGEDADNNNNNAVVVVPSNLLSQTALSIHKHVHATTARKQLALEWKMECEILPHLAVLAASELRKEAGRKIRLEILVERRRLRMESGLENGKKSGKKGQKNDSKEGGVVLNKDGNDFGYYARHPNGYMSSFVPPPPLPSDDEDSDADDGDDAAANEIDNGAGGSSGRKSKTKLTKDELLKYHAKVEEECNFAPSKIAERAKLACSLAYEYALSSGMLDEYYADNERRKVRECEEKERISRTFGAGGDNISGRSRGVGVGGVDGTGEVRRSSRARTTVNYGDDGTKEVDAMLKEHEGLGNGSKKSAAGAGTSSSVPNDKVSGGPTARYLLDLLGLMPEEDEDVKGEEKDEEDEEGMEEEDEEQEEEEEEEDAGDDPFFEPSPHLIIDQLGRKHRYLSPASVQAAIVRSVEGAGNEEPAIDTPECLLEEEDAEKGGSARHVTDLVCTTGDNVADLGQFEPTSFARCRFAARTFVVESEDEEEEEGENDDMDVDQEAETEAKRRKQERRLARKAARKAERQKKNAELERHYRAKKSFELWRFRSIHGEGCTVFPKWEVRAKGLLREMIESKKLPGGDAVMDEASANAVATAPSAPSVAAPAPADPAATTPAAPQNEAVAEPASATTAENDEQLARSLAAAEANKDDDLPLAKRRRTTRRAAGGDEPVFYGGYQSMSKEQLHDTLVRLLYQATTSNPGEYGSSSLTDLKRLIFPENYETSRGGAVEMKRLRAALGHLVYRTGRIGRLLVDCKEGDMECLKLLESEGGLVKFVADESFQEVDDEAVVKQEHFESDKIPASEVSTAEAGNANEDPDTVKSPEEVAVNSEEKPPPGAHDSTNGDTTKTSVVTPAATAPPPPPAMDPHLKLQLQSLERYISNLHCTELALRKSLMKVIDKAGGSKGAASGAETLLQVSTSAIATAADEVEGAADAADWKYFLPKKKENGDANDDGSKDSDSEDDEEEIEWSCNGNAHDLLGMVIYRPQSPSLRPAAQQEADNGVDPSKKCYWHRVVSHTPSVKEVQEVSMTEVGDNGGKLTDITGAKEARSNPIVSRRMRLRAMPIAESDIDAPPSAYSTNGMMDIDEDEVGDYMVLTEAQAWAGAEAAVLHKWIEGKKGAASSSALTVASATAPSQPRHMAVHPYKSGHGSRVMLTPQLENDGVDENGKNINVLYGVITGYDYSTESNQEVKNKLLILLEGEEEHDSEKGGRDSCAFWSTVNAEGTTLTDIVPHSLNNDGDDAPNTFKQQLCSSYTVDMHEFYQGSPAYNVCQSTITYLKNHSKAGPFLQPVDPVALGIPNYPTVITNPMDISTLTSNLEEGKYSRIPPKTLDEDAVEEEEDGTNTSVYRMAYGPFFDDVMLIFDNCVTYNGQETWIGNEATVLKKNVTKKMQQLVSKALWSGQGGGGGGGSGAAKSSFGGAASSRTSSRAANKSKGMYADEDSDVDMYEYESEYEDDDDFGGSKRKSRKGKGGKSRTGGSKKQRGKEDSSSKAIEQPFVMPDNAHDYGSGYGAFPYLKVRTEVGKFTLLSEEWSCRYVVSEDHPDEGDGQKEDAAEGSPVEEDEMLMLLRMQKEEEDAAAGETRRSTRARHAPKNYADEDEGGASAVHAMTLSSSARDQVAVTLPGVEYFLKNEETFHPKKKDTQTLKHYEDGDELNNSNDEIDDADEESIVPTVCTSRLGAEGVQETLHEGFYAKLYRDHSPNALILDSGLGKYVDGSFPPYLGRVLPAPSSSNDTDDEDAVMWEIREQYLVPALRWVLRGLVRSGHLEEVEGSLSEGVFDEASSRTTAFSAGIVVPSHEYYYKEAICLPYDVLDEKEILRKRRQKDVVEEDNSSEEEVELSAYEQMRAERVKRNAERLKALGLG